VSEYIRNDLLRWFVLISDLFTLINTFVLDANQPSTLLDNELCIDDLFKQKRLQMKIDEINKTTRKYIVSIGLAIMLFIIIVIVQINIRRLYRYVKQCMPISEIDKFIGDNELWKISSRSLHIDYNRCIGNGNWSNVYIGI